MFRVLAKSGLSLSDQLPGNNGIPITIGEALMAPTVIYMKQVTLSYYYSSTLDVDPELLVV